MVRAFFYKNFWLYFLFKKYVVVPIIKYAKKIQIQEILVMVLVIHGLEKKFITPIKYEIRIQHGT
jgi:hypothetical protein